MRKIKKKALVSATIVGASSVLLANPTAVIHAKTTVRSNTEGRIESRNSVRAKKIYVETIGGGAIEGTGTEQDPYTDFKNAYKKASAGDTLVLLNAVTIQNDDNNSDQGVFTFDKEINIEGHEDLGLLTSRVPVQLEANITMSKMEFTTSKVYLNGYSLKMTEVKTNFNNDVRTKVFGGSFQGTTRVGDKSMLVVDGFAQNPFEFDSIYAGSEIGTFDREVEIVLNSGAKVLNSMDASGGTGNVSRPVKFIVGNVNVPAFNNTNQSADTTIQFEGHNGGPTIKGYKNVTIKNSNLSFTDPNAFTGISGKLELIGNSVLDISINASALIVDQLVSEMNSRVVLNKDSGKLKVNNDFSGTVEIRTPGGIDTSGIVKYGWPYLEAKAGSTGTIVLKRHISQQNAKDSMKEENGVKQWVVNPPLIQKPIHSLEIQEGNKIDLSIDEQSLHFIAKDVDGNAITYSPDYDILLKDGSGNPLDENDISAIYDSLTEEVIFYVDNGVNIASGSYTMEVTEIVTGKKFELPLQFYRPGEAKYTVVFDSNGGTGTMNPQTILEGETKALSKNVFQREGHTFKGWSTTKDGTVAYVDEEMVKDLTIDGNTTTLYAVWEANHYSVVFDSQGGSAVTSVSVVFGELITQPPIPTKSGYTFGGWYSDAAYTNVWDFGTQRMPARNLTLYAKWNENVSGINQAPTIQATNKEINVGDSFDPLDGVTALDPEDGPIAITLQNVSGSVNTNVAGTYYLTYSVTDSKGATATKTIVVKVVEKMTTTNSAPKLEIEDIVLTVGDTFDPAKAVKISDLEDDAAGIPLGLTITGKLDTTKAGVYEITYSVKDSQGLVTTKTIKVTVKEKEVITPIDPANPSKPNNPNGSQLPNTDSEVNKENSINTGDATNIGLFASTMLGSALGTIALLKKKKEK